ncbi:methyltransferase domain-containing protein [Xylariaceae sp. FL1651]|nr:methyltransferase domain-containing protein [Xylariaceae sp. FL1651]
MANVERAYNLTTIADTRAHYDTWAATYNEELADPSQGYVAPGIAAQYVLKHLNSSSATTTATIDSSIRILDAGCGTGLVGAALSSFGADHIDGVDLSPGMLEHARKTGAYKDLETADLSQPLKFDSNAYDIVVCIGTLTQGHVGPEALTEFVRVAKKGGLVVATIVDYVYEKLGYKTRVEKLESEGKATVVSNEVEDYRRGAGIKARMLVLKVLG